MCLPAILSGSYFWSFSYLLKASGGIVSTKITPHMYDNSSELQEVKAGNLSVRLARTEQEKEAAQALRYKVFFEELGAHPDQKTTKTKRDVDVFDDYADHLLVIDHSIENGPRGVVGCYRLLRADRLKDLKRFYSANEYDLKPLLSYTDRLLEVGRSCIAKEYRGLMAMQLLWIGIAAYIRIHKIDVLFGCASFPGSNAEKHKRALAWLYHNHLAPQDLRVKALPNRYVSMNDNKINPESLDETSSLNELPPLIKGYIRLGGYVGDGAVVDEQFNTTDVAIIVKSEVITDRFYRHYERRLRDA